VLILTPIGRTDAGLGVDYTLAVWSAVGLAAVAVERKRDRLWIYAVAANLTWLFIFATSGFPGGPSSIGSFAIIAGAVINLGIIAVSIRRARSDYKDAVQWLLPAGSTIILLMIIGALAGLYR